MKKKELLETLEGLGFFPGKLLGQNFLIDENMLDYIVRATNITPGENVLEVGPGFGVLTRRILKAGGKVTAVEFDHRICEYLRNEIKDENFTLIEGDACRVDFEEILGENCDFRSIANLPYSVSTPFLAKLLRLSQPPKEMIFMLQKEMGMRLAANIGTKNYGGLSVRTQALYDVKILKKVPPQVFHPEPGVDSAVVQFVLKSQPLKLEIRELFENLIKTAFTQRRKIMLKQVYRNFDKDKILSVYEELGINSNTRAEQLSPETFVAFAECLSKK